MNKTTDFADLEDIYDLLAVSIDQIGSEKETLFLSKLCLILAHHMGDPAAVHNAVAVAMTDIDA